MQNRRRRRAKDAVYAAALQSFSALTTALPEAAATRAGEAAASLAYTRLKGEAARTRLNLAGAFPEMPPDAVDALARDCFRHLGAALMDVLRFDRLTSSNIGDHVEIRGLERVHAALAKGRGCLIATAHYGNWELFGAALALSALAVNPIVRELRSATLDRWIDGRRRLVGMKPASRQRSLRGAVEALKANEVVVMLPDVDTSVRGVFVEFFGRPAYTAVGPALLSARYGTPLLSGFLTRQGHGRHLLIVDEPVEADGVADTEDALVAATAAVTTRIEAQIRRHPEQWIWMHRRWRTQPGDYA